MKNIFLNKSKYTINQKIDMNLVFHIYFYSKRKTAFKSCLVLDCKYITF